MSLSEFRNKVLSNTGEERVVEVNQRFLIDKILARYSSAFAIYRELMQNSDDANSLDVVIKFENESEKLEDKITSIIFENNGIPFSPEDWNRLKKIAEGNPDEQKIGAFGIGFYSLFSVCENPFVSSNGQGMAFYWREHQLFTKKGPTGDKDKVWTKFLMDMKEHIELPDINKFTQFLANSLAFTKKIQKISVYFNDTLLIQLSKEMQEEKSMNISEFHKFSPRRMFHLTSVHVRDVQLNVEYQSKKPSISFRIASGNLNFEDSDKFSEGMERITKKKPPSNTIIQMIFTGSENYNEISPVFKELLSYPEQGKIYIGFPTHQTTGCCSHFAANVIPTAERESIDMAEKTLAIYNSEMLSLAGTLCRILYENELAQIKQNIIPDTEDDENTKSVRELVEKLAANVLSHFTFKPSSPDMQVGSIIESQFFDSKQKLFILSTNGVLPISDVRIPNSEMAGFIKIVPVIPKIILEQCNTFLRKAKDKALIKELTLQDVFSELRGRILSEDEMVELLKWWISYRSKGNRVDRPVITQFMQLARFGDKSKSLSEFRYFLNPNIIPPDVADVYIPATVLPYAISKKLKKQDLKKDLETCFVGWSELSLVDWARYIANKPDLEGDPTFAKKVHQILAKCFSNISKINKEIICQLFAHKKCIPTDLGMMIPGEAYFQDVNIFPDLPTIQFEKPSSVKNIMELLGVRKVVDLQLIFDRLIGQGSQEDWDHIQLVKYLASKSNNLNENDKKLLKTKPIWPKEDSQSNNSVHFLAKDLYAPLTLHREFGLPVIDWKKGRWSHNTQEGKFLITLGLRTYPPLEKILELATSTDNEIRDKALKYFIDNFEDKYFNYYRPAEVKIAFLPCSDLNTYAKPSECFINSECTIMKFQAIRQDLRFKVEKLGVHQHPSHEKLLESLIANLPKCEGEAKAIFEYLASRQADFTDSDWKNLADLKFIPIIKPDEIVYTNPRSCFFRVQEELNDLSDFFTCVDFGDKANRFLQNCGVKTEPSPIEFAELLVNSSYDLFTTIGHMDSYYYILRLIAFNVDLIAKRSSLIAKMKNARILVAVKHSDEDCYLASASEIFINDDKVYQKIFDPLTAPEDELLESLYRKLGCRSLQESVNETSVPMGISQETESQQMQNKIRERARYFYFECPKDDIKRDEEWLKNLKVREIECIKTKYRLGNNEIEKDTKSCILKDEHMDSWTLYITPTNSKNFLEISQILVKNIYNSHNWKDISYLHMLLTTPLSTLEEMGYPVDRILQQPRYHHITNQIRTTNIRYVSQPPDVYLDDYQSFDSNIYSPNSADGEEPVTTIIQNFLQGVIKEYYSNSGGITDDQASILNAVKAQNSNLNGAINIQAVSERRCNIIPDNSLYYVRTIQGVEFNALKGTNRLDILRQYDAPLNRFISMLIILAEVFKITPRAIHVFHYINANSIAFNRDRALFFSLDFYLGYHHRECIDRPTINVMKYWYTIFCHQLAHNFIQNHNAKLHEKFIGKISST